MQRLELQMPKMVARWVRQSLEREMFEESLQEQLRFWAAPELHTFAKMADVSMFELIEATTNKDQDAIVQSMQALRSMQQLYPELPGTLFVLPDQANIADTEANRAVVTDRVGLRVAMIREDIEAARLDRPDTPDLDNESVLQILHGIAQGLDAWMLEKAQAYDNWVLGGKTKNIEQAMRDVDAKHAHLRRVIDNRTFPRTLAELPRLPMLSSGEDVAATYGFQMFTRAQSWLDANTTHISAASRAADSARDAVWAQAQERDGDESLGIVMSKDSRLPLLHTLVNRLRGLERKLVKQLRSAKSSGYKDCGIVPEPAPDRELEGAFPGKRRSKQKKSKPKRPGRPRSAHKGQRVSGQNTSNPPNTSKLDEVLQTLGSCNDRRPECVDAQVWRELCDARLKVRGLATEISLTNPDVQSIVDALTDPTLSGKDFVARNVLVPGKPRMPNIDMDLPMDEHVGTRFIDVADPLHRRTVLEYLQVKSAAGDPASKDHRIPFDFNDPRAVARFDPHRLGFSPEAVRRLLSSPDSSDEALISRVKLEFSARSKEAYARMLDGIVATDREHASMNGRSRLRFAALVVRNQNGVAQRASLSPGFNRLPAHEDALKEALDPEGGSQKAEGRPAFQGACCCAGPKDRLGSTLDIAVTIMNLDPRTLTFTVPSTTIGSDYIATMIAEGWAF